MTNPRSTNYTTSVSWQTNHDSDEGVPPPQYTAWQSLPQSCSLPCEDLLEAIFSVPLSRISCLTVLRRAVKVRRRMRQFLKAVVFLFTVTMKVIVKGQMGELTCYDKCSCLSFIRDMLCGELSGLMASVSSASKGANGKDALRPCTFRAMILGKDSCPLCIACMGVRHAQVTLANLKHCPHFPFFRQGFWREECGWRPLIKVTPPFLLRPRWRPNSHLCFAAGASLWMKSPPSFLLFSRSRQRKGKRRRTMTKWSPVCWRRTRMTMRFYHRLPPGREAC